MKTPNVAPSGGTLTRVPAGLSAYYTATVNHTSKLFFGTGAIRGLRADGTAVCDFVLASGTCTAFELAELQLKPISVQASMSALVSVSAHLQPGMHYTVEWEAASPVRQTSGRIMPPFSSSWSLTSGSERVRWQQTKGRSSSEIAAMQLQALQAHIAAPRLGPGSSVLQTFGSHTSTVGLQPSPPAQSSKIHNFAGAMLSVAAQEQPATQWQSYSLDSQTNTKPCKLPESDSFGIISTGGAWLTPMLTVNTTAQQSVPVLLNATTATMGGTVLVSGGLGDIGSLVGMWLAATCPAAKVLLLSRTGHSKALPTMGPASFTAVRCDVSSGEELSALTDDLSTSGAPPVAAIFHAGGLIQVQRFARTASRFDSF